MSRCRFVLCLLLVTGVASLSAIPEAAKGVLSPRVIRLAVTPPGKDAPTTATATHENELVTVVVPNLGAFAFSPVIASDNRTVVVTIYDDRNEGHKVLGKVEAPIGGKVIQSKTTPSFGIKIVSVSSATFTRETR